MVVNRANKDGKPVVQAADFPLNADERGCSSTHSLTDASKFGARRHLLGLHLFQPLPNHIERNFAHAQQYIMRMVKNNLLKNGVKCACAAVILAAFCRTDLPDSQHIDLIEIIFRPVSHPLLDAFAPTPFRAARVSP